MVLVASSVIFAQTGDRRIDNGLAATVELAKVIGNEDFKGTIGAAGKECDSVPRNGGSSYRSHVLSSNEGRKEAVSRADVHARNVGKDRKAF